MVSPARRRDAVCYLQRRHRVSERRACRVVAQHRSTQRYRGVPPEAELRLVARMNALADRHPRYGYRRIWALLRTEGWVINRKRIERLWRLEGHRVPPRRSKASGKRAQGKDRNAAWALPATGPDDVWSYDFVSARTRSGAPLRILNVVDEYTRLAVGCRVAPSIGAREVQSFLEELFRTSKPRLIRSDNGRAGVRRRTARRGPTPGVFAAIAETFEAGDVSGGPGDQIGPIPVVSSDRLGTPSLLQPIQASGGSSNTAPATEAGGKHATRVIPSNTAPLSPYCAPPT